jgi:hypothetical protein
MNAKSFSLVLLASLFASTSITIAAPTDNLFRVDYPSLVSRADLTYTNPVSRSEEGLPVGNGTMGSLVWTIPDALKFQLNRVDVFAAGHNTRSFPEGGSDYASGCGMVDIRIANPGDEVFAGEHFQQHLSVYDGIVRTQGRDLTARVTTWQKGDVMLVDINDERAQPETIAVDLRMLRYATPWIDSKNWELRSDHAAVVRRGQHTATSALDIRDGRIVLTQEFSEGDFYNASAIAIGLSGRSSRADFYNETTVRLSAPAAKGAFTILMATAASQDPEEDVAAKAIKALDAAQRRGVQGITDDNVAWWKNYWSRAFVRLHSDDGEANFVEENYTYFLYIMASSSRGRYMPHFNGMLWYTLGDVRQWGSQYWGHNTGCYYNGLTPANRPELLDPYFSTYSSAYASYERAARQQWGSKGIWLPETTWFDGLEDLPDAIAAEMRELYLMRKPWDERSDAFMAYARNKQTFNSRWNWIDHRAQNDDTSTGDKGRGPFGHVTHTLATTAKVAYLYWLRYDYHRDKEWLRTTGYPMIKGAVELYRNFPNVKKGKDGKYHIHNVNNGESNWNSTDTVVEVSAMYGLTPLAIRAATILDVDADLRVAWQAFYDNLTPLPDGTEPARFYDLMTLASEDHATLERLRKAATKNPVDASTRVHVLSRAAVGAANLGLADYVKHLIPGQIRTLPNEGCDTWGLGATGQGILRNRLGMREGPGCLECQRLGNAANALHAALLQTAPSTPFGKSIIRVFPAWPKAWDAQFTLAARGAFVVSACIEKGTIAFVQIHSQRGGACHLKNPWPDTTMTLFRNGKQSEDLSGDLVTFLTQPNETITIVPKGTTPARQDIN